MTKEEIIGSPLLSAVILNLITIDFKFKDIFKNTAPTIAADIESASTNPNCTCRNKVNTYIVMNSNVVGTLLFDYSVSNKIQDNIQNLFNSTTPLPGQSASGRVAKTTIKDWPDFVKSIQQSNLNFAHMSTSIVGDDVYVFFL